MYRACDKQTMDSIPWYLLSCSAATVWHIPRVLHCCWIVCMSAAQKYDLNFEYFEIMKRTILYWNFIAAWCTNLRYPILALVKLPIAGYDLQHLRHP